MKTRLFILFLFFLSQAGLAQVSAPDLRCLEIINAAGHVKLTWIAPADPQNQFFDYEIYYSPTPGGPFTVVGNVNALSTTNFVHTSTVSGVQSVYYAVGTRYGTGGTGTTAPTHTLRTLFLNINVSLTDAYKLMYNELKNPNLPSTSPTFTIGREYPTSSWSDLVITPLFVYNDTLSLCNSQSLTINYQVKLLDNSGCTSLSNIQGGEYHDKHDPNTLTIDSISVFPDGKTILAWKLPSEKDVVSYDIQKDIGGLKTNIASLQGYNVSSYVYSGASANNGTIGLAATAIDSCDNGGAAVDYAPVTMYLQTFYNYCTFETEIDWTPYKWDTIFRKSPEQLLEYRVYASEDSGATFTRLGTTTGLRYIHKNVKTSKPMCYFVRVINKRMTMTASSNRSYFYSGEVPAPEFVYIKTASVIKRNVNEIHIYVDPKQTFKNLDVERSADNSEFTKIGTVPYGAVANYSLLDEKADTDHRPYFYRVRLVDSCGNYRLVSNTAKTILLTVAEDPENYFQRYLTWTNYIGFDGGVLTYEIYRAQNDIGKVELVGKADTTNYFVDNLEDAAPYGANIEYVVKAVEGLGNRYAIQEYSSSNFAPAYMEGTLFIPNAFAPEGHNKTWKPVNHFIERKEYNVSVFNHWGQLVFETNNAIDAWDGSNCPNDTYTYIVSYKNSRGEYIQQTGNVTLIR